MPSTQIYLLKNQTITEIIKLKSKQVAIGKYSMNLSFFIIMSPGNQLKFRLFTKNGHIMPIQINITPIIIIVFCIN